MKAIFEGSWRDTSFECYIMMYTLKKLEEKYSITAKRAQTSWCANVNETQVTGVQMPSQSKCATPSK